MRRTLLLVVALFALPLPAAAKLRVVASLPTLGALARDVGGDDVEVEVLSSARQDPHYVDPRPDLIVKLSQADLLVQNGLELEIGWLPKLLVGARNDRIQPGAPGHFDASTLVTPLEVPTGRLDRAMGDIHPGGNPHFLFDPRAVAAVARGLGARLATLDPPNAAAHAARAEAVAGKLEALAREERARFDALTPTQRRIVVYHRSFPYLLDWLGLSSVAEVEPRPGISPDPGHVAKVLGTLRSSGARAVLQESFYPSKTSQTLAQLAGVKLIVVPGGADFGAGQTTEAWLRAISQEVLRAL